jgi:hypothetical protein
VLIYNPRFVEANILLAKLYLAFGDRKKALEQAEAALKFTDYHRIINEARSIQNEINMN